MTMPDGYIFCPTVRRARCGLAATVALGFAAVVAAAPPADRIDAKTRALHESLLTLDTHLDTPMLFGVTGWDFQQAHRVEDDGSQLDYPRMVKGGLDGGFFATYIPQGPLTDAGRATARDAALLRLQEIHQMVAANPSRFELAYTPDDARRIAASKKRIVFLSMENGYPLGQDLSLLTTFYALGVRLSGPVHFLNNDLGDSSTDPGGPKWHGLSPLGREYVKAANRLGILLDASHASDEVLDQMLELSTAPIILSHSGTRAVFDHPRGLDDEHLRRLAAKGGVIQIYAYSDYFVPNPHPPEREAAIAALRRKYAGQRSREKLQAQAAEQAAIDAKYPIPHGSFDDFIAHLEHAVKIAGVEHVGIGLDFDGGGGVTGLKDATDYPKITARLLKDGLTKDDLAKIWSGNALRVLGDAQAAAAGH
jgi:membrane dipeptidase